MAKNIKEYQKEYQKKYYKDNKEKLLAERKEYQKEYHKQYYKDNKEKLNEYQKEWKQKNKGYFKKYYKFGNKICKICNFQYPSREIGKTEICYLCRKERSVKT
jgi:hypothetical protein